MRKAGLALATILVLVTIVWAGGDPWKTKPFAQWTEKDIQEILANSPWARSNVQPQGAWRPDGVSQVSGNIGVAGTASDTSNRSAGSAGNQPGAAEKNASAAAAQSVYSIYWWSSRTIRAASMRRAVLKGSMTEADAEKTIANTPDEYMILVQGTNMTLFQQRGEKSFENAGYIQLKKNKQKISPSKVAFLKAPDGSVNGAVFYFPKKASNGEPTIAPDEKGVDCYLQVGEVKILTSFEPKKMVDSQGEDL
jgi:hypothetical protein